MQISIFGAEILVGVIIRSSQDSAVGNVTGLRTAEPTNHGSISGEGKKLSSSPKRPDSLWGPIKTLTHRVPQTF
jgi:hypothetical protein